MITYKYINFVLQYNLSSSTKGGQSEHHFLDLILTMSSIARPPLTTFTFQIPLKAPQYLTAKAAIFMRGWTLNKSKTYTFNRYQRRWLTIKFVSSKLKRWAEQGALTMSTLSLSTSEIRYLFRPHRYDFNNWPLKLRGSLSFKCWSLIVYGDLQLNRPRYV